jgi:hypothetical protein
VGAVGVDVPVIGDATVVLVVVVVVGALTPVIGDGTGVILVAVTGVVATGLVV